MNEILNPTIFIGNFEWREPITTLTDFLVAIVAFAGFLKFHAYQGKKSDSFLFFKYYFLCFTIGMASAAWFGHGLQAYVGPEFKRMGWICSTTGLLFFGLGTLIEIKNNCNVYLFRVLKIAFIGQFLIFVFLMVHPTYSDFIFAQLSSTVSLIVFILPLHVFNFRKTQSQGSMFVALTIAFGILPGVVFNRQLSIDRWFNYHDISHVLMAVFMLFMIGATSKLTMVSREDSKPIRQRVA